MQVAKDLGLTEHQHAIGARVVAEEAARREHVVIYLSGAHAYGFPSPDSDLDLKAIHMAPARDLLGLSAPTLTFDRAEVIEGVEIDYTSNELGHALAGILQGNGNFLERVLGRTWVTTSPMHEELAPLVKRALSRRVHRHYRGFASSQVKELEKKPTVKKLLYVLRTALTGTHLLRTGELEADLTRLADVYGRSDAGELVLAKRAGERTAADPGLLEAWRPRLDDVLAGLDASWAASVLPEEPPASAAEALEAWLVETRTKHLR
ncbi:MAG: nucleotidyltransferase domain-containing protein [Deltaproteobacteria bacterium]|nr:nucleotidyltransferase domain-containing protein [Deltaproteobacteria bacterium]